MVLSPDADEPLLALDPDAVYMIGGIVDRSPAKGITRGFAAANGVRCARLPIAEYLREDAGGKAQLT